MPIVKRGDLEFGKIKALSEHVDAHDDATLPISEFGEEPPPVCGRCAAVDRDRVILGCLRPIEPENRVSAINRIHSRHEYVVVALLKVRS